HAHAQNQNEPRQAQARQLLDWLGFTQLLEQSPLALDASIEAEAGFRNATAAQQAAWRRELQPRLRPQQLQQDLLNYVLERYRPENIQHVEALLQGALEFAPRSEEHTSELQSRENLVCRLLLEKKNMT